MSSTAAALLSRHRRLSAPSGGTKRLHVLIARAAAAVFHIVFKASNNLSPPLPRCRPRARLRQARPRFVCSVTPVALRPSAGSVAAVFLLNVPECARRVCLLSPAARERPPRTSSAARVQFPRTLAQQPAWQRRYLELPDRSSFVHLRGWNGFLPRFLPPRPTRSASGANFPKFAFTLSERLSVCSRKNQNRSLNHGSGFSIVHKRRIARPQF